MGFAVASAIVVAGDERPVAGLDGVSEPTSADASILVVDDDAVADEVLIFAVVIADDGPQPERMTVSRIAADSKGQQQPAVGKPLKPWRHFAVGSERSPVRGVFASGPRRRSIPRGSCGLPDRWLLS